MATVNTVALQLVTEFGGLSTETTFITQVERWISEAYRNLASATDWEWLRYFEALNTVASTAEYSLSTSLSEIIAMRIPATEQEICHVDVERMISLGLDLELTGIPELWYQAGFDESTGKNKIRLYPVPNAIFVLSIVAQKRPADLSTSTVIPCPDDYLPLIKDATRAYFYQFDGQLNDAGFYAQRFASQLGVMLNRNRLPNSRPTLKVSDIPQSRQMNPVRLPPNHFGNY